MTPDPLAGIRDGILRGVAHAFSNRVAALSGVASLVEYGGLSPDRLARALGSEVGQLGALVELVRLLTTDPRARPEAIQIRTVLPQIVALQALDAELRDVPCIVRHDGEAPPVHLVRSALVKVVLVLVDAAKRDALGKGSVSVAYAGDARSVIVAVESHCPGGSPPAADDVARLEQRLATLVAQVEPSLAVRASARDGHESSGVRLEVGLPVRADARSGDQGPAGPPADRQR